MIENAGHDAINNTKKETIEYIEAKLKGGDDVLAWSVP